MSEKYKQIVDEGPTVQIMKERYLAILEIERREAFALQIPDISGARFTQEDVNEAFIDAVSRQVEGDEFRTGFTSGFKTAIGKCAELLRSRLTLIDPDRVLADGMVGVDRKDVDLFMQWYRALKDMNPLFLDPEDTVAYERILPIRRAQQAKGE